MNRRGARVALGLAAITAFALACLFSVTPTIMSVHAVMNMEDTNTTAVTAAFQNAFDSITDKIEDNGDDLVEESQSSYKGKHAQAALSNQNVSVRNQHIDASTESNVSHPTVNGSDIRCCNSTNTTCCSNATNSQP